jgi:hypothetical protein
MLDSTTAPLGTTVSPTRRGVRSGSEGYPRASLLQSAQPSYNLFDDFNYQEPSPDRQLSRYNNRPSPYSPTSTSTSNDLDQFPYYQPNHANSQALTRSPWNGTLWNPETQGNSVLRSFFILSATTIGAGLACQAYAAHHAGWMLFLIFQIIVAWAADSTHVLMADLAEATGVTSYEDLVDGLYGTVGTCFISMIVLIQNLGSMAIYVVLFTQSAPFVFHWLFAGNRKTHFEAGSNIRFEGASTDLSPLYNPSLLATKAMYVAIAVVVFVLPFSFFKRIGKLGVTSCLVACAVIFMTSATINSYYTQSTCPHHSSYDPSHKANTTLFNIAKVASNSVAAPSSSSSSSSSLSNCNHFMTMPSFVLDSSTFISLPMIVYAFMSHATILPIHHEMSGIKRRLLLMVVVVGVVANMVVHKN